MGESNGDLRLMSREGLQGKCHVNWPLRDEWEEAEEVGEGTFLADEEGLV